MQARERMIVSWEGMLGREGSWCQPCRRSTPAHRLLLAESGSALLRCESCDRKLFDTDVTGIVDGLPRQERRHMVKD